MNTVASQSERRRRHGGRSGRAQPPFFFGAIDPQWETHHVRRADGFPLESLGDVDRDRRIDELRGKGHVAAVGAHRFDASFFGDPANGPLGAQRSLLAAEPDDVRLQLARIRRPQSDRSLRRHPEPHFLVDASFGRALNRILETPSVDDWQVRDLRVTSRRRSPAVSASMNPATAATTGRCRRRPPTSVSGLGEHQIRYGFDYEHLDFSQLMQYTGPTFKAPNGQQTATGADRRHHSRSDVRPDLSREPRQPHRRAADDAEVQRDVRRGRLENRQLADDPSGRPV